MLRLFTEIAGYAAVIGGIAIISPVMGLIVGGIALIVLSNARPSAPRGEKVDE